MKRHEQHCEAPCQRRKKHETEKEDMEVPQRGQGGGLVESNQAQRRLANKKEEETGRAHRTRGQRRPRQTQTAKNLSKKDSEGIYGKAIGPEKGTTIIRAHTAGRKCIAIYKLSTALLLRCNPTHTWTVSPKLVRRWRKMTINLTHGLEAQGTEWALWSNDKIAGASLDAWPGKHHRRALRRTKRGQKSHTAASKNEAQQERAEECWT